MTTYSPEVARELMKGIAYKYRLDTEAAHSNADDLLCDILVDLGYREMVEVFREMDKWYT